MKEPTRFLSCRRLYLLPSLVLLLLGNVLTQGQDVDPPTVTSFSPAEGAFNVPVNTPVTFTFSEKMNPNPLLSLNHLTVPVRRIVVLQKKFGGRSTAGVRTEHS